MDEDVRPDLIAPAFSSQEGMDLVLDPEDNVILTFGPEERFNTSETSSFHGPSPQYPAAAIHMSNIDLPCHITDAVAFPTSTNGLQLPPSLLQDHESHYLIGGVHGSFPASCSAEKDQMALSYENSAFDVGDAFDGGFLPISDVQVQSNFLQPYSRRLWGANGDGDCLGMHSGQESPSPQTMDPTTYNATAQIYPRFSREAIQILKRWLTLHGRHPYPSDEDQALLQHQTGLNRTQISNWLANARRRKPVQPQASRISRVNANSTEPIDIPRRPGTPAWESHTREANPLQRWVDSPPENEPASVSAIAKAVASNWDQLPQIRGSQSLVSSDQGSQRSRSRFSSGSSAGTSSGLSYATGYSHSSNGSSPRYGNAIRLQSHRRRRKRAQPRREDLTSLTSPLKPYQCTFCTMTYKTKHDWQRHEKSLHLSLESWVCASDGPQAFNSRLGHVCCVFCGKMNPDDAHIEGHNYSACKAKPIHDRTFYRKDHINQHLKLVHDVNYLDWSMKPWKIAALDVRSRCGFCNMIMNSWPERVEHLGAHFKGGSTMADWKGDWGFEAPVMEMLKNAIPPYLIEMERTSPFPFIASCAPTESPRSAYELIVAELTYFLINQQDETGLIPSDTEMHLESCRIILASEVLSPQDVETNLSWLRDLLMASEDLVRQAKFSPLRQGAENKLCILKINGKDNLFEQCPLEQQLRDFVQSESLTGSVITDSVCQEEACQIIGRTEDTTMDTMKWASDYVSNWLVRLIMSSTAWLTKFRQRANLPPMEDSRRSVPESLRANHFGSLSHSDQGLERSIRNFIDIQRAKGIEPSNEALGREARRIIQAHSDEQSLHLIQNNEQDTNTSSMEVLSGLPKRTPHLALQSCDLTGEVHDSASQRSPRNFETMMKNTFLMNDVNIYRRLAQELTRFVTTTMSPNNPDQHIPSDMEIQYQARWIMFDSDDPWNQTAADNDEWLQRFKRDVGILAPETDGST